PTPATPTPATPTPATPTPATPTPATPTPATPTPATPTPATPLLVAAFPGVGGMPDPGGADPEPGDTGKTPHLLVVVCAPYDQPMDTKSDPVVGPAGELGARIRVMSAMLHSVPMNQVHTTGAGTEAHLEGEQADAIPTPC
ncbi:MAG: hypothetical protein M0Z63_01315, partial [Actinomycetota bacterium]|nr:hypothetical protein [Actinomycetota bacterium]